MAGASALSVNVPGTLAWWQAVSRRPASLAMYMVRLFFIV